MNVMWFRSDLRVYDNPALSAAMKSGDTVAVFCLTPKQWDEHKVSPAKLSLLMRQVRALATDLKKLNVPLLVLNTKEFANTASHLVSIAKNLAATQVFFNIEYEINEIRRDEQVIQALAKAGVAAQRLHDQCMVQPGAILNGTGESYKVFSAFKRAFLGKFYDVVRPLYNRPDPQRVLAVQSDLLQLEEIAIESRWESLWPAGEDEAHERLNRFVEQDIRAYDTRRDIPALAATSTLSPYLAIGALTTRQCMQAAISENRGVLDGGQNGVAVWMNELIWREFYRHLLVFYPRLCRGKPFKSETDGLPWKHDQALFLQWCNGQTGVPIVDAAMQQLLQTGWMHNRLRMVTAMYLTKDLFIDWRWGEAFFMQHLVDGDFASNNGGWQWSASTGVDAVPYFRVFNPVRQSQRFDPAGTFIRQYLPQLKSLDNKRIHDPDPQQALRLGYSLPLVNHRLAVEQTKSWFKALNDGVTLANTAERQEELKFA